MSTNPEGTPHNDQDTITNLRLRLHHAEMQRDAALAMMKAEMKEIITDTFIYVGGQLGLVGGTNENKRHEFVRSSDYIKETERLKAEVELWKFRSDNWQKLVQITKTQADKLKEDNDQLQARCDFLEGRGKQ
jgi:hypothetical protein